jgi:hypothetical protein
MEQIEINNVARAAILGAAGGLVLGYVLGKRKMRQLLDGYENDLDAEREELRKAKLELERELISANSESLSYAVKAERAEEALKEYQGVEELQEAATEVANGEVDFEYDETENAAPWDIPPAVAQEYVEKDVVTVGKHREDTFGPAASKPRRQFVDKSKPYVITDEQFLEGFTVEGGLGFAQDSLTYYEGDDTLADNQDKIMDDSSRLVLVGTHLSEFGENGAEPNSIYVRNEKMHLDLEVTRDMRKYSEVVGGFGGDG